VNSNLQHDPIKASSSPSDDRGTVGLQGGTECFTVGSLEHENEKVLDSDVGILNDGCAEYEMCIKDATSSLGRRFTGLHDDAGVIEMHRDLEFAGCIYPNHCIQCNMSDGSARKKCEWYHG
jgi:hypothetical protein